MLDNFLKTRVVEFVKQNNCTKKAAEIFGVSRRSVQLWCKKAREGQSLENIKVTSRKRKIEITKLTEYLRANPDKTLKELSDQFNVVVSSVWKQLKKAGITLKKSAHSTKKETKKIEKNSKLKFLR